MRKSLFVLLFALLSLSNLHAQFNFEAVSSDSNRIKPAWWNGESGDSTGALEVWHRLRTKEIWGLRGTVGYYGTHDFSNATLIGLTSMLASSTDDSLNAQLRRGTVVDSLNLDGGNVVYSPAGSSLSVSGSFSAGSINGYTIGVNVQAYDTVLAALSGLTSAADKLPYFTGSGTASMADFTAYGRSIVAVANESAFKALVNLQAGTDFYNTTNGLAWVDTAESGGVGINTYKKMVNYSQPLNSNLTGLAGLSPSNGDIAFYNSGWTLLSASSGSEGQVIKLSSGLPGYQDESTGSGAFSDASDPIVQNSTGKDVHIGDGAGTLAGKLEIGGDADQPQLVIEGHSTQTDDVFIIQNDADTEVFSISVAGVIASVAGAYNGDHIQNGTIDDDALDFTDITLNDFTFDIGSVDKTEFGYLNGVTSAIQAQLDAKESSSSNDFDPDRIAGDTSDNNLLDVAAGGTGFASQDTFIVHWGVLDTVITGDRPGWTAPMAGTVVEVGGYTDANTTTFNIEKRAAATPNTAGTDVLSADLVADTDKQVQTSINSADFVKDAWLVPTISETGDVAVFSGYMKWIRRAP